MDVVIVVVVVVNDHCLLLLLIDLGAFSFGCCLWMLLVDQLERPLRYLDHMLVNTLLHAKA